MRALIADRLEAVAKQILLDAGWEVIEDATLSAETLAGRLAEVQPDALVVRSTQVTAAHIQAAPSLGLVVRAGAGVNTIDLEACSANGIYVANCPGKNAIAVAELVFGLALALDRNLVDAVNDSRAGLWNKGLHAKHASGLYGRTIAILGMGTIGEAVAWRARGFGMEVRAWSRSLDERRAKLLRVTHCASPQEAAAGADVLSVHVAATAETKDLVDASVLAAMPDGGIVINAARHEVLDEQALLDAVLRRGFRAGLDVLSTEPKSGVSIAHPLLNQAGVIVTPHVGASTRQASEAVAAEVARILLEWAATGRVDVAVNVAKQTGADGIIVVRHLDRVGVLAAVLEQLRSASVNVQEMENTILTGRKAAIARISVAGTVGAELVDRVGAVPHVLSASYARR